MAEEVLERLAERARVGVAVGREARHGDGDDPPELFGHVRRDRRLRERDARDDAHHVRPRVRRRVADHVIERGAEQVDVGGFGDLGAAEHLRGHVVRRARELGRVRGERHAAGAVVVEAHRDAPVEHVHLSERADHDVLGLEIAMHDPARVREVDCVRDLDEHAQVPLEQIGRTEAASDLGGVPDEIRPGGAFDLLQHDDRSPVGVEREIVDRHDVRVLERGGDPRLAEQLQARSLVGELGTQRLRRDLPSERALRGTAHDPHAALAERRADLEAGVRRRDRRAFGRRHDRVRRMVDHRLRAVDDPSERRVGCSHPRRTIGSRVPIDNARTLARGAN
jgi:hypothetical protein